MNLDYHIKANDVEDLYASMLASGLAKKIVDVPDPDFVGESEPPMIKHLVLRKGVYLDIIGDIQRLGSDGEIEVISGCHANLRVCGFEPTQEQLAALPIIGKPNRPVRCWA